MHITIDYAAAGHRQLMSATDLKFNIFLEEKLESLTAKMAVPH